MSASLLINRRVVMERLEATGLCVHASMHSLMLVASYSSDSPRSVRDCDADSDVSTLTLQRLSDVFCSLEMNSLQQAYVKSKDSDCYLGLLFLRQSFCSQYS